MAELLADTAWGAPFETHFIIKHMRKLSGALDLSSREKFIQVVKAILRERTMLQINIDIDLNAFYESLDQHDYAHVVDQLIRRKRAEQGFKSWGDKTPLYVKHLQELHQLFPKAKFILMVRDGRDVALSLLEKEWGPVNIFSCAELWKECYKNTEIVEALENKQLLLTVCYEDVLKSPEASMERVFNFIGASVDQHKISLVANHVRRSNFNKWRTAMTSKQITTFESVAATSLIRLGYDASHEEGSLPPLMEKLFRIDSAFKGCWQLFKLNVIDEILIRLGKKEPFGDPN